MVFKEREKTKITQPYFQVKSSVSTIAGTLEPPNTQTGRRRRRRRKTIPSIQGLAPYDSKSGGNWGKLCLTCGKVI